MVSHRARGSVRRLCQTRECAPPAWCPNHASMVPPPVVAVGLLATIGAWLLGQSVKKQHDLKALRAKTNAEWLTEFEPWAGALSEKQWTGTLVDLFSPDYMTADRLPWDTNPQSRRFIDLREGELQVSEDLGDGSRAGRRFFANTTANPVLEVMAAPNARSLSFISKVPPEAPPYADAQAGALNFTAVMGRAFGRRVLKLNTLYNGTGGPFVGFVAPPDEYNFWLYV